MPDKCIEWDGYVANNGYGSKYYKGKPIGAHRWAYIQANGEIPKGMVVRHTCDNKTCVNPMHLVIGTHQDNMRDKIVSGIQTRGEDHGTAKLTETQAREIYEQKHLGPTKLAGMYGVAPTTVSDILAKRTWRHIHG